MVQDKLIRSWIILDYKTEKLRLSKREPKSFKASEIPIELALTVSIPETPRLKAEGHIDLSIGHVNKMILESIRGETTEE